MADPSNQERQALVENVAQAPLTRMHLRRVVVGLCATAVFAGASVAAGQRVAQYLRVGAVLGLQEEGEEDGPAVPQLYCVAAMLEDSYEQDIFEALLAKGMELKQDIGIFACDGFDVFSSDRVKLGESPLWGDVYTTAFKQADVGTSIDNHAANAVLFANMWTEVQKKGLKSYDWVIKVDPDTVLFPERLKLELQWKREAPRDMAVFVSNCAAGGGSYSSMYSSQGGTPAASANSSADAEVLEKRRLQSDNVEEGDDEEADYEPVDEEDQQPTLFGSLEVFSKEAMQTYFANGSICADNLPLDSWGEDRYMGACMGLIGVGSRNQFNMVSDAYCDWWMNDTSCTNYASAYHPFKSADAWLECWQALAVLL